MMRVARAASKHRRTDRWVMAGRDRLMDVYEYAISSPFSRLSAADTAIMMPRGQGRGQWPTMDEASARD